MIKKFSDQCTDFYFDPAKIIIMQTEDNDDNEIILHFLIENKNRDPLKMQMEFDNTVDRQKVLEQCLILENKEQSGKPMKMTQEELENIIRNRTD